MVLCNKPATLVIITLVGAWKWVYRGGVRLKQSNARQQTIPQVYRPPVGP